ncbi:L-lactate permease [Heyndrickxia acidiproducens]|uniref:L-lactate permease n=1 Tax=Heyndrickxia acidiproducens TaxID=1121084 RepID=UPI0003822F08|nr:L-lactate permease [Heyndrickxia acidiproducens]
MTYVQNFIPIHGHLFWSALIAVLPIAFFFWALAIKKIAAHLASFFTMLLALAISVIVYKMPAALPVMSATQGIVYGLVPISWIIVNSVFLYKLTVKTGQFDVIRNSVVSITEDRRLQALLIAFSFGAFLEGSAGFGAPVAITAALLVGLGFNPLYAAGICLLANTAPVAFGAIGSPVIAMAGPTGLPALEISKMIGRQLPLISMFIPLYLIIVMAGFKKAMEVLPALLVSGLSFAVTQFFTANFMGPELPDVLSALVSLITLAVFLKFWKPKSIFYFKHEEAAAAVEAAPASQTKGQIAKAWSPFIVLTIFITIWGIPQIKLALTGQYTGGNAILNAINGIGSAATFSPNVPFLNNHIINSSNDPIAAMYKLDLLGTAGTAIFAAAIMTKFLLNISWKDWFHVFFDTLKELKFPILTILFIVGFAYVMNASGMITTLALTLAKTAALFPFFSPVLGWLGVFITGSDTSSNVLFGTLQQVSAQSVGMNPLLALGANSSGGVTGKMISPQSIAVACAATGLIGRESELLRFTVKHSLFLLLVVCILTFLQSNVLSWMVP